MSKFQSYKVDDFRLGIDAFRPDKIAGWIFKSGDMRPVRLVIQVNGEKVGTFRADAYRSDLINMREDGRFSFSLTPFTDSWEASLAIGAEVDLMLEDGGALVARTTWNGTRQPGVAGLIDASGHTLRLNKGKFVVPLSERTAEWRQGLLSAAQRLVGVSRQGDFSICASYGTLLGAVRDGAMIPHDDDVDLMLISESDSMLGAVTEFHRYQDYLRSQGFLVEELSNGQIHVTLEESAYPVDVFLAWMDEVEGLSLTFTVRGGVPFDAVAPLGEVEIEGVRLPAPSRPEVLLEAIYGPGWNVPDPDFRWQRPESVVAYFAPLHNYQRGANNDYWNGYYSGQGGLAPPDRPSQFALFALSVRDAPAYIVDLGCGSGRDSLYMGANGIQTLGVDYSQAVIYANSTKAAALGLDKRVSFQRTDVSDLDQVRALLEQVRKQRGDGALCVYSRFFFHAIDESTQGAALLLVRELLTREGDYCALEFRTDKDRDREKVTPSHYRRYVNPDHFIHEARDTYGLVCDYRVEGTGYAVFKSDDAHVVRLVLRRG
ncbi:MAG: LicD family protein [Pseudoxanthomonas sp.]|nr:LicD family protein [Pseudoxanthomonas sp.]